jgi:hypothetical protein
MYEGQPDVPFPFSDSPELGVFVARMVFEGAESLQGVVHDDDGDWTFEGSEPTGEDAEPWILVHLVHVVDLIPSVRAVADLPTGWAAELRSDGSWDRYRLGAEERGVS